MQVTQFLRNSSLSSRKMNSCGSEWEGLSPVGPPRKPHHSMALCFHFSPLPVMETHGLSPLDVAQSHPSFPYYLDCLFPFSKHVIKYLPLNAPSVPLLGFLHLRGSLALVLLQLGSRSN